MGCCLSTDGETGGSEARRVRRCDGKGTSFTSTEEETVKEVLSETPARPACFVSRDNADAKRRGMGLQEQYLMMKVGHGQQDAVSVNDEVSDVGSLCENVVEGRESSEYYRNRTPAKCMKSKSFSGEMGRQRSGRRSPVVKSSEPSPVRRRRNESGGGGGEGRLGSRDSPQKATWGRPETGERSGRRSRSPGMRVVEMGSRSGGGRVGRSPSGRKMQGQSPNRGRGSTAESSRRNEEDGSGGGGGKWAQGDESLENPLVALECFIFL